MTGDELEALYEQAVAIEDDYKRRGLVIEAGFRAMAHMEVADGLPPELVEHFRRWWFAGCVYLFNEATNVMSGRADASVEDTQFIQNLMAEMESFRQWATQMAKSQ